MLTPGYYAHCADEAIVVYGKLEERITRDIVRRIMKTGYVTDTAKWQAEMLQQSGMLYDEIIDEVAALSGESREAIQAVFEDAGVQSVDFDNKIYESAGLKPKSLHLSKVGMQTLLAGISKTNGELANLTKTTAEMAQTAYINACSIAEMEITSGAFDYNTAIRHAIDSAMEQGVSVKYPSGHVDKLDVAVRRSVMTGVSQTTGEISLANARDMGTDLMEITAHGGARPSHAEWQGKLVSLSGRKGYLSLKDIGYGKGDGFKGYNCRHDWFPFIKGLSSRAYTDEQLKSYQDKKVSYNGKEMPQYEAEQKQRAMERQIREERRKLAGYDEAIKREDNADSKASLQGEFDSLAVKMKSHEATYKDFSKQTGLPTQTERIQVKGFNRSVSQKAVQANKKVEKISGSVKINGDRKFKVKTIRGRHTVVDDLKRTNPNYKKGEEYRINCQRCVPAFEMRRRGLKVEALPRFDSEGTDKLARAPYSVWKNPQVLLTKKDSKKEIEAQMQKWGDGARAQIVVIWKGGRDGHTFIAEQLNGTTYFLDPQSGRVNVASYFDRAVAAKARFCRIDTLAPSNDIKKCIKRSKK